ncbi:DrmE family protein [Ruminococcaceae bacterium OttesenSCG-928-N02]|nr:DrmE family protein [Ruminococcaceae bacterium OttesenSCG-928-N02]
MTDQQILLKLTETCDIFFENSLISKELIIKKYVEFFSTSISSKERSSSVALHTGSICFDVMSLLMTTLACVSLDQTDPDEIIAALSDGEMVLFKNERYRWRGLETMNGQLYMKLEQDARGKNGPSTLKSPFDANKGLVKPYNGTSEVTDGRGIRKQRSNRSDFISYVTGKDESDIPGVTGVSAVIIADRATFDRVQKGLRISYDGKDIGLLDIVPASYYTDGDEPYQFGSNPSKAEPVLKIAGKVSVARDLVLDKHGSRVIGLIVIGSENAAKGFSELEDLLRRKTLKFTLVSMGIDSENAENYINSDENSLFACTKEFLLHNSMPTVVSNPITDELDRQVENIVNSEVLMEVVEGGCSWDTYRKIRNALFIIKQSDLDEERKKDFVVQAYSLLNLFVTAVFPMSLLEQAVSNGDLQIGVSSPAERLNNLWTAAENCDSVESQCILIVDALDDLYKSILSVSPKHQTLKKLVQNATGENIAVIVPKAYYADVLRKDMLFLQEGIQIMTANRFDASRHYDKVIVVGDFSGKRFDALKCKAAANIVVLLYECETHWFKHKKRRAAKFERKLNTISDLTEDFEDEFDETEVDEDTVERFEVEAVDLEEYIDTISIFDIRKFVAGLSPAGGNAPTADISAIGRFVGGEQIMFSKFYKAIMYNPSNVKDPISETDVEKLIPGDRLVFTKRDAFTRNIVDSIYDALQNSGKLSSDVLDATEKAAWWKEVLRDYQQKHCLSYRQLAKELNRYGSSLSEMSIRQWLVAESHIVGPREEITLRQIAEMTGDTYLLSDIPGYFNACRTVRRQRKKILDLIGKAIEDKLSGHQPPHGSELEIVYDNVEALSETLELETVTFLDESIPVPISLINKPIIDVEVGS